MKRLYHGISTEISITPSGKDQSEVGMYVDLERSGWKNSIFIPDSTIARVIGREMYYALICEFFPNDFQSRPNTPQEYGMVYKRVRRRSSNTRLRMTPQEVGVEAEPYDKHIVDTVVQSSQPADIGEARLRVERSVFQSIQMQECDFDSAEKLWWDIKFKISMLIVCIKQGLLKIPVGKDTCTFNEVFDFWKSRQGMSDKEMYHNEDGTLTQIGQSVIDTIETGNILYRLLSSLKAYTLFNDDTLTVHGTNTLPELNENAMLSLDQSRIVQVVLIVILFAVLIAGVSSFSAENKKIMNMLNKIYSKGNV